jgi:HD superfamily phosphohydrolase
VARQKKARKQSSGPVAANLTTYPDELAAIRDVLATRYSYLDTIAEGKTGIAYRLGLTTNPEYFVCLKTIRPTIGDPDRRREVGETLTKEVEILVKFRHRSLPAVMEDGTKAALPYYVCSYHPGMTFANYRNEGRRLAPEQASVVISELINVISYVHASGRTHCDLHAGNVLIGDDVLRDGILVVDFGSGHRASDSSPETANRGNAGFKPADSLRVDRLQVDRTLFAREFQLSDIAGLGKLLTQMHEVFVGSASPLIQGEYQRFCADLERNNLDNWDDIIKRGGTVFDPLRCIGDNADLFLLGDARRETITIPVVGPVGVGVPSLAIINTPDFQRLRHLKQLSFCDWNFPGATHSRFEHALGVYALGWEAMNHLAYDQHFRLRFGTDAVRGFLLASLIHDIGHYPFAHAVEQYVASRFQGDEHRSVRETAGHEKYTIQMISDGGSFHNLILEHWGTEATAICRRILEGKMGSLSHLLDGPLDIDKMDYLTRDAYHAGLSFGGQIDSRKLCVALECDEDGNEIHGRAEHLAAIEGFVLLQDQLYGALYWHPAVRAVHAMFQAVIAHIVGKESQRLHKLVDALRKSQTEARAVNDVIIAQLAESPMLKRKRDGAEETLDELVALASVLAAPDYAKLYHVVQTYTYDDAEPKAAPMNVYRTVFEEPTETGSLSRINWNHVTKLRRCYLKALRSVVGEASDIDILVDVPFGKGAKRFAKIRFPNRAEPVLINEVTHLNRTAFDRPVHFWSPIRVFVAPRHAGKVSKFVESIRSSAEDEYFHGVNPESGDDTQ